MRTEHIYIPSWERFAGKPYVKPGKNTRKTGVIAGTVKDAQELLAKRPHIEIYRFIRDSSLTWPHITTREHGLKNDVVVSKPAGPPQTLGELCIELAQTRMYHPFFEITPDGQGALRGHCYHKSVRRDIQNLRTLMYHKHTDPAKERRTQRAERLIELVRNAYAPN